jgi:tryptophan 2,3-dioxygenase
VLNTPLGSHSTPKIDRTQYMDYLSINTLLSLQQEPSSLVHRDEQLFQIAHQSTELWLKQVGTDLRQTLTEINLGSYSEAHRLIERCCRIGRLLIAHLKVLATIQSGDFAIIRRALGGGSGADSPGWENVRTATRLLDQALSYQLSEDSATGRAEFTNYPGGLMSCIRATLTWDELLGQWRIQHFNLALHLLGKDAIGTQGTSMQELRRLIGRRACPRVWEFLRNQESTSQDLDQKATRMSPS